MKTYSRSIRIPAELKAIILREKKDKSINKYIKGQLIGNNNFSEFDFEILEDLIKEELNSDGHKINDHIRNLHISEVVKLDFSIIRLLDNYIDTLQSIKNKKIHQREKKKPIGYSKKSCFIKITLHESDKKELFSKAKESGLSVSEYIRGKLFDYSKYTRLDFCKLEWSLSSDFYRTIHNIKQIILVYEIIDGSKNLISEIEERRDSIETLYEDIQLSWKKYTER